MQTAYHTGWRTHNALAIHEEKVKFREAKVYKNIAQLRESKNLNKEYKYHILYVGKKEKEKFP
jgi:hypothetical protein